jgi:small subunit ribosomal protein S10
MKIIIKLKSLDKISLTIYLNLLKFLAKKLYINSYRQNLPLKKKRITLLKSPHVNKSSREQFEFKLYKSIFVLEKFNNFKILKNLIINKPKSVKLSLLIKK